MEDSRTTPEARAAERDAVQTVMEAGIDVLADLADRGRGDDPRPRGRVARTQSLRTCSGAEGACRRQGAAQLAERARQVQRSYEKFAATLYKTETESRDSHGGQSRIKAARFPARKTHEEFDFALQTSLRRETVLHLGKLDFLHGRGNVVLLGPPGTGRVTPLLARRARLLA